MIAKTVATGTISCADGQLSRRLCDTKRRLMAVKLGKPVRGLGPKHIATYPIWVGGLDEAKYDEDHVAPVLSKTANVTRELIEKYFSAFVVFRVEGTDLLGVGEFRDLSELTSLWIMVGNEATELGDVKGIKAPLTLRAIPKLFGKPDVRFKVTNFASRQARGVA